MSVLPAACPIQGIMHQCYHRGIRGNGLRGVKYALAGPHPLSEWAVESWGDGPMLGYTFIIPWPHTHALIQTQFMVSNQSHNNKEPREPGTFML